MGSSTCDSVQRILGDASHSPIAATDICGDFEGPITAPTPRNPVSLCPMEIWGTIFARACDPRGKNAAAISQVSRYFYQAIKPYRLESLVIYGVRQIVAFHEATKMMPPDVPLTKHLYIGLIPDSVVTDAHPDCDAVIDGWIQHREETPTQRDHQIRRNLHLSGFGIHLGEYTDIQQIVVAGVIFQHRETLRTLTYLTPLRHISFQMFGCLPCLKDLTVVCLLYKSTFSGTHSDTALHQQTQFPLLERFHVSYFDTEPLFRHDELRRVAPNLRYLRISGRKCYPQFEKLHSHTKVLVQTILISSREQREQVSHMGRVLSNQEYRQRVVLLEPGRWEDKMYGFFGALLDWLDVSTGGDAFWGSTNQVEIDELAAR